ncbi:hypothetical protein [Microviridae sp.]|nr:hypothetical protein [Microviridae sp.]
MKKDEKLHKKALEKISKHETAYDIQTALKDTSSSHTTATKYKTRRKSVEYFHQPSLTNPDHDVPLKTLLERHSRGQSVAIYSPHFDLDANGDGLDTLELNKLDTMQRLELASKIGDDLFEAKQLIAVKKQEIEKDEESVSLMEQVGEKLLELMKPEEEITET